MEAETLKTEEERNYHCAFGPFAVASLVSQRNVEATDFAFGISDAETPVGQRRRSPARSGQYLSMGDRSGF